MPDMKSRLISDEAAFLCKVKMPVVKNIWSRINPT